MVGTISIQTILIATVVMAVVALIFIPNILCCLWIVISIISIEVGVMGYMSLWNVNLDVISMINLIMGIGFSVDFSSHISYAFLMAKAKTSNEKIQECLSALGLPVLQAGLSTIVGVITLSLSRSYVFLGFCKIVFLVVLFGILHGIVLLPVLLSILGPGFSCQRNIESSDSYFIHRISSLFLKARSTPKSNAPVYMSNSNLGYNGSPTKTFGTPFSSNRSSVHNSPHAEENINEVDEPETIVPKRPCRTKSTPPNSSTKIGEMGEDNDAFILDTKNT